jgi:hypothetical protein
MPQIAKRSFTAGEIAPALRSRADLTKYMNGLALCQNFFVRAQGGVYTRPGLRFVGELDDATRRARLIPFSFNTEQTYILVFEHLKMRVIRDGGYVLAGGGPSLFELATPYTEDQIPRLGFAQSADVMTLVHPEHDPANLSRTAHDAWALDTISYAPTIDPPVFTGTTQAAITGITQANPGVVTTSASHGFSNNDFISIADVAGMTEVNERFFTVANVTATTFELKGEDTTTYTAYVSGGTADRNSGAQPVGSGDGDFDKTYNYVVTAVDAGDVESLESAPTSITTGSLSQTAGVRLTWATVAGAVKYRVYKDPSNQTDVYGWIGDSKTTTFDDFNLAPITSDAPPEDRQPFTGADNNPSAVTYYQQRQVFANTLNEPQVVYTTQTGNYQSLRTSSPARDDDAVTMTIVGSQVNEIRHMVSMGALLLMTSGGEWLTTEGENGVLTPSTVGVRQQSYNGASWVPPVVINATALYVQEKGSRIRDLGYEFSSDQYTGNDLSLMSEHLFDTHQIEEMAYSAEPYSILWCVRGDGVLLGLTYQREHQVWGWHQHSTQGIFESVASITEDDRDAVYVIVKRTVNGSTVRYVERLEPRRTDDASNAFCVDSGLTYSGAPATTISGLDHLEGESVAVLADGNEVRGLVVSGGAITLPREASVVHVGLPYTPTIELLDIEDPNPESIKGKEVSISRVILEVEDTRGGWVGPKQDDGSTGQMYEIKPRFEGDGYNTIALKSFKSEVTIEPQWAKGGGLRIEQRAPLPMAILSAIPMVDIGGN